MRTGQKVKRELLRIGRQFAFSYEAVAGHPRRIYYDQFLRPKAKISEGTLPLQSNVAVVLIYQPGGVPESVFFCLDYLYEHGISPIVVSNAPLSPLDKDRLHKHCHFLMERLNFGYDFGGYRDAILELTTLNSQIENLFLINDSVWFPAHRENTLLAESLCNTSDVFGVFYDRKSKRTSKHFLHSYFYRFGADVLNSGFFQRYWRTAPIYNRKEIIIKKMERNLTAVFKQAGFSVGALYQSEDICRAAMNLDNEELLLLVNRKAQQPGWSADVFAPIKALAEQGGDWKSAAHSVIQSDRFSNYYLDSPPHVLLDRLKSPIIKKHVGRQFQNQRKDIFSLGLDPQLFPVIRDEIRHWDEAD